MIQQNHFVATDIRDVKEITIDEIVEYAVYPFEETKGYQRRITVRTEQGETFELWLYADDARKLELQKPDYDADWLKPKVYTGSQNAEGTNE